MNLDFGCKTKEGWTSVDEYPTFDPGVVQDLEHSGMVPDVFPAIMKEPCRTGVSCSAIPINGPPHVRPVTRRFVALFGLETNLCVGGRREYEQG
ncbi:MAG: hypothetical protein JKY68_08730 [Rhodospirillales bacterium]|nr:hypothetical protein [Rhodospirillales bacterium]